MRFRESVYRKTPFYFIDVVPQKVPNRKIKHPAPYIYHPELFPDRVATNHPPLKATDRYRIVREVDEEPKWLKKESLTFALQNFENNLHHSNRTIWMLFLETASSWFINFSYWFLIILFWACWALKALSTSAIRISRVSSETLLALFS